METQKDRILKFKDYLNMSMRAFESSIGVSFAAISHSKGNLSHNIVEKSCSTYPMLNRIWLLTGDGEMLLKSDTTITNNYAPNGVAVNNGEATVTTAPASKFDEEYYKREIARLKAEIEELKRDKEKLFELLMKK